MKKEARLLPNKAEVKNGVFHIIHRQDLLAWEIRQEGAEEPIKLFAREIEALEFGKILVNDYGAKVLFHGRDGKNRTL